ncbi:hypothetical protein [Brevundimonas sp. C43]|uniref:hypothetical protein n=1 Tax=Brevundimonas sp. C43 TaxID=3068314 RepID=UPI00273F8493|nr:hypothetical protein [Brevundimonas sp. C43]
MTDKLTPTFGSFEDWNWQPPMVAHVMEELARAHWDDEGETYPGFAAASGGLRLAVAADTIGPDAEKAAHVLHHLGWIAAYMTSLDVDDDQRGAFGAIIAATEKWKS